MHLNIDCFAILCNVYKFLSGHLYDWVKKGKGLGNAEHDESEIEENNPKRRKHLTEKNIALWWKFVKLLNIKN